MKKLEKIIFAQYIVNYAKVDVSATLLEICLSQTVSKIIFNFLLL